MGIQYPDKGTPRADLGAALYQFNPNARIGAIGDQVLPVYSVPKEEATLSVITRETLGRREDVKHKDGAAFNRGSFDCKDISYKCQNYGEEETLTKAMRERHRSDFDAELARSRIAHLRLAREYEIRVGAAVFDTTVWTGAALYTDNSGSPWDAAATDMRAQIEAARAIIEKNTGFSPNTLILSQFHRLSIMQNTKIQDSIKYVARLTAAEMLNAVADYFGVDKVLFGKMSYNTADEGQDFEGEWVWNRLYAMLAVCATDESMELEESPHLGRTVLWESMGPELINVDEYYENQTKSDVYRVEQDVDEKIFDPYFAHLIKIDA